MPVKYHCPACAKRFIDWGAEKLGYKCPDCGDEELIRIGLGSEKKPAKRPTLRRAPKKKAAAPVEALIAEEDEDVVIDDDADDTDVLAIVDVDADEDDKKLPDADVLVASDDEDEAAPDKDSKVT